MLRGVDRPESVIDALAVVDDCDVVVDDDVRRGYEVDWTGRFGAPSLAVVRPTTVSAVAEVVSTCRRLGVAIVTQGGNTGLVGGSVPRPDLERSVVLSMRSFDDIGEVDTEALQVTAGAGVTIARWRDAARAVGMDVGVDFAARESATVGGAIATNAGGSRVVRFGTMRHQVVGVEAVLGDGSVVGSLDGLPKETAGLHWPSLLCGSEGTMGIVTRARLRLVPHFPHAVTAVVSTASTSAALDLLRRLRSQLASLDAVEIIRPGALELVTAHLGVDSPVETPPEQGSVLVIECAGHDDPSPGLFEVLADADPIDTAVATDGGPRRRLLDLRDRLTESIAAASTELGVPTFKLDVAVPLPHLDELLSVAQEAADADGCRLVAFGHLAEGNLHLNHLGANDSAAIAARVLPEVARLGGTISAEHGIGIAKADYLELIRTPGDLAAQRAIVAAVDPDRILNPGVLGR